MYMTRNKTDKNVSKLNISKITIKSFKHSKNRWKTIFDHHITCIHRRNHNDFILIVFHF